MLEIDAKVEWNKTTLNGLKRIPDDILYLTARETLDLSQPIIPKSNTKNHAGTLRRATSAGGVRGGNGDFYIGSYTNYAKYVWKMSNVHWTTPGTNNKWFARALKQHSSTIINNAINQSWRKDM